TPAYTTIQFRRPAVEGPSLRARTRLTLTGPTRPTAPRTFVRRKHPGFCRRCPVSAPSSAHPYPRVPPCLTLHAACGATVRGVSSAHRPLTNTAQRKPGSLSGLVTQPREVGRVTTGDRSRDDFGNIIVVVLLQLRDQRFLTVR